MTGIDQNGVKCSSEDESRLTRLDEEVRARLFEMATIVARTLGETLPKDAVLGYLPPEHPHNRTSTTRPGRAIETHCSKNGCGYWDSGHGVCYQCVP